MPNKTIKELSEKSTVEGVDWAIIQPNSESTTHYKVKLSNLGIATSSSSFLKQIDFNSDLDTISKPVGFVGSVSALKFYTESKITRDNTDIKARLDSTDTWTDITQGVALENTISNLLSWVTTNVSTDTTQWEIQITIDMGSNTGETWILITQ